MKELALYGLCVALFVAALELFVFGGMPLWAIVSLIGATGICTGILFRRS